MAVTFARDDARRRITLTAGETMSYEEWRAAVDRQIAEGCWHYSVLIDMRQRVDTPSTEGMRRVAAVIPQLVREHGTRGPVAFVVNSLAAYGMGRMYSILAGDAVEFNVFQDIESAEIWLARQTRIKPDTQGSTD